MTDASESTDASEGGWAILLDASIVLTLYHHRVGRGVGQQRDVVSLSNTDGGIFGRQAGCATEI